VETRRVLRLCLAVLALLILAAGLEPATALDQPSKPQPPNTHYQTALADLRGGDTDKAALEVKLALQENPLDAASHFLLGCLLERKGERDQAIVAYQRAVALDPTNPDALYNLGTMLLWRGEVVPASSRSRAPYRSAPITSRPTTISPRRTSWPGSRSWRSPPMRRRCAGTRRTPSRSRTCCSWPKRGQPRRGRHLPAGSGGIRVGPGREACHRRGKAEHAIPHLAARHRSGRLTPAGPVAGRACRGATPPPGRGGRRPPGAPPRPVPREGRAARRPAHPFPAIRAARRNGRCWTGSSA